MQVIFHINTIPEDLVQFTIIIECYALNLRVFLCKTQKIVEMCGKRLNIYIYIYNCMYESSEFPSSYIFFAIGGVTNAHYPRH